MVLGVIDFARRTVSADRSNCLNGLSPDPKNAPSSHLHCYAKDLRGTVLEEKYGLSRSAYIG